METTKELRSWEEPEQQLNEANWQRVQDMRIAPKGKFQLLLVDTFEGPFAAFPVGVFDTVEEALTSGTKQKNGQTMMKYYVYDDKGDFIAEADPRDKDAPSDKRDITAANA